LVFPLSEIKKFEFEMSLIQIFFNFKVWNSKTFDWFFLFWFFFNLFFFFFCYKSFFWSFSKNEFDANEI